MGGEGTVMRLEDVRIPELSELLKDAEREFSSALGAHFYATTHEILGEVHYRGGFRLTLTDGTDTCEVLYSDMEIEAKVNGRVVFGPRLHEGFEGNMFSREHLREHLPRIAASAVATVRARHAQS